MELVPSTINFLSMLDKGSKPNRDTSFYSHY